MGNIADPQNRLFLTHNVDILFCNNYNDIMNVRSDPKNNQCSVDDCIAGLFTQLKPGAKLITLHPIQRLPPCLATANEDRQRQGLSRREDASFYQLDVFPAPEGEDNFTFKDDIKFYVYTRCGPASFLCSESTCSYSTHPICAFAIMNEGSAREMLLPVPDCPTHDKVQTTRSKAKPKPYEPASGYVGERHHNSPQAERVSVASCSSYSAIFGGHIDPECLACPVAGLSGQDRESMEVPVATTAQQRDKPASAHSPRKLQHKVDVDLLKMQHEDIDLRFKLLKEASERVHRSDNAIGQTGSFVPMIFKDRDTIIASKTAGVGRPHGKFQHEVDDDLVEMQREVIALRMKMLKEDPDRFRRSDTTRGRSGRTEMGKRNVETWTGASRSEVPSNKCMRQLLDHLGMNATGCPDVVRRRFKRTFTRDSVSYSGHQWHVCKAPTYLGRQNPNTRTRSDAQSMTLTPLLLQQEESSSTAVEIDMQWGFEPSIVQHDCWFEPSVDRHDVCFSNDGEASGMQKASDAKLGREGKGLAVPIVGLPNRVQHSIDLVYKYLYSQVNKQLDANGASTYAEITRQGVSQIIEAIETLFMPRLTKSEAAAFRAIDLGGGFLTCLAHIAQVIPGEYAGIEYDACRSFLFANSYGALLATHSEDIWNTKIAYAHLDVFDLHSYDCDLVYTFDEAFPPDVWAKIIRTFVASPRCKFMVMFKAAKAAKGYKDMQRELQEKGLTEVGRLYLKKKGGETSNAMFLTKARPSNQKIHRALRSHRQSDPSKRFWEHCKEFWGDTEIAKKAVAELKANTEQIIIGELKQRR
jgi:hypothetical protein